MVENACYLPVVRRFVKQLVTGPTGEPQLGGAAGGSRIHHDIINMAALVPMTTSLKHDTGLHPKQAPIPASN